MDTKRAKLTPVSLLAETLAETLAQLQSPYILALDGTRAKVRLVVMKLKVNQLKREPNLQNKPPLSNTILKLMDLSTLQITRFHSLPNLSDPTDISIHKVILNLHQRFHTLLHQPVTDILDPYNPVRLRFLNMLSWFYEAMEKTRKTGPVRRWNYVRCSERVTDDSTCVAIRVNHKKFLTPPICLIKWRHFKYNRHFHQRIKGPGTRQGANGHKRHRGSCDELMDLETLLEPADITRVKDLELITGEKITDQWITSGHTGHSTGPGPGRPSETHSVASYLLVLWYKRHQMDFETFRQFENILLSAGIGASTSASTSSSTSSTSSSTSSTCGTRTGAACLKFPRFYTFILKNGIELSISNPNSINLNDTPKSHIKHFFKSLFLRNLLYYEVVEDELNKMILGELEKIRDEVNQIFSKTLYYYLWKTWTEAGQGPSQRARPGFSQDRQTKGQTKGLAKGQADGALFDIYYTANQNSIVARTLKHKLHHVLLHPYSPGPIRFKGVQKVHQRFHQVMEFYYEVYCETLNWVYEDCVDSAAGTATHKTATGPLN